MKRRSRLNDESGVALFLCLFALLLITSIGLGLMFMASTETAINYNYRSATEAYYGARAGVNEGMDRLRRGSTVSGYSITLPSTFPTNSSTTGVTYILNPTGSETVAPWDASNAYFDNELCNEYFLSSTNTNLLGVAPVGNGIPCSTAVSGTYYSTVASQSPNTGTAAALPYKWVRITLKQNKTLYPFCPNGDCSNSTVARSKICWNGQREVTLASLTGYSDCNTPAAGSPEYTPVYVVTSLAKTKTGSKRMYQAEFAEAPPLTVSSAVASQAGVNLTGSLTVNGYDACSCSCTTSGSGSNQTTTCVDRPGKTCDRSRAAIMSASAVDNPNSSQNVVAGTGPIIENLHSSYPAGLDADTLIDQYSPGATVVTSCDPTATPPTCGSIPNPFPPTDPSNVSVSGQTSMFAGDADLSGGGGSGVLIVDGNLTIHGGGFKWYGLILVRGTVTFQGGGSAGTNIVGAVIAGQQANANVDTTLGGSVVINLDMCAVRNSFQSQPLHMISSRELLY